MDSNNESFDSDYQYLNQDEFRGHYDDFDIFRQVFTNEHLVGWFRITKKDLRQRLRTFGSNEQEVFQVFPELKHLNENEKLALPKIAFVDRLREIGVGNEMNLIRFFVDIILEGEEVEKWRNRADIKRFLSGIKSK